MRLAFATLFLSLFFFTPASAQGTRTSASAAPVMLASSTTQARAPRAPARLFARIEVGITPDWPAGPTEFADYAAQEIEAGSVEGDLYVRWSAFGPHARQFAVDVALAGHPATTAATVTATDVTAEYGVHLLGLAPGLYQVRMREIAADGTETVSTPVTVRV